MKKVRKMGKERKIDDIANDNRCVINVSSPKVFFSVFSHFQICGSSSNSGAEGSLMSK